MDELLTKIFPAVRISERQHKLLESFHTIYTLDRAALLRELLEAWLECALKEGRPDFPIKVQVDREKLRALEAERLSKVEEIQAQYSAHKSTAAKKPQKQSRPGAA
jgi:hypothetical protein